MKTVFKTKEIPSLWINQSVPAGRAPSALSFRGKSIFSYWAEIGRIVGGVIILSMKKYSRTTNKHRGMVRRAIPSRFVIVETSEFLTDESVNEVLAKQEAAGNMLHTQGNDGV